MGCNQSRKEHTFTDEEIKKLRQLHQKLANSNTETRGKDDISVQSMRDQFLENPSLGERLHEFMMKLSSTNRIDCELFIDILELLIKKSSNKRLNDLFARQDKVGLLCIILFPRLRKTLAQENIQMNSLLTYSEALDVTLCILRMLNAQPDQKVNEAYARTITDRLFRTNDAKVEFWTFGMLIKEQINLISTLIYIYLRAKFLDGTVPFLMPTMPDIEKQVLVKSDQLTQLYLNNSFLLNSSELRLLYQGTQESHNFDQMVQSLTAFSGETFVLLRFEDEQKHTYTVGGFNPLNWTGVQATDNIESYIFALHPTYRHFNTIYDQFGTRPLSTQNCYLQTQESYGREKGLSFGFSRDDARIWLDTQLDKSFVKNTEKYFKKGPLIPNSLKNPICTLVEIYGIHTDLKKKNFSFPSMQVF